MIVSLLAFFVAIANSLPCICTGAPLYQAVTSAGSSTSNIYVLGTPVESTKTQQMTHDGEIVVTFDITGVKYLNKPAAGVRPLTQTTLRVGYAMTWDDCGFASNPFTWGQKTIFMLGKSEWDLVASRTAPVDPPAMAPTRKNLPMGPLCYPTDTDEAGVCIKTTACDELGAPYKTFAYTETDLTKSNCRSYAADVKCCAAGDGDEVDDAPLPAREVTGIDFALFNCGSIALPQSIYKTCTSQESWASMGACLSLASSNALAQEASRIGLTDSDIPGLSTFQCAGKCQNGGRCVSNKCVCTAAYQGANCETAKPLPKMTISNIIPGGTGNDVWQFGATRTVTFEVKNWDAKLDVYSLEVNLVNRDAFAGCSVLNAVDGYYREAFASKKLSDCSGGTCKISISHTLDGLKCSAAGSNWAVEVVPMNVDGEKANDAQTTVGLDFQAAYASCASSGYIGQCQPKEACKAQAGWAPITDFDSTATALCGANSLNTCCVPNQTPNTQATAPWFRFTSPAADSVAPIFYGQTVRAKWTYDSSKSYSAWGCSVTQNDKFTLELVRTVSSSFWSGDSVKVVQSWADQVPTTKGADFNIDVQGGEKFIAGEHYFQAKFTPSCVFKSRKFNMLIPGCSIDSVKTYVGQCVPAGQCIEANQNAGACKGISGATCCYKTRTGMSPGFRDDGAEMLENASSASTIKVAIATLLVVLLALF